ncbi:hypothetical protein F5888DRAFT_1736808 [Russula emetica]|nr:hypothetical protein F5888DRAFT_1736808 [Russula emetica]
MPLSNEDALARIRGLHAALHAIATAVEAQQYIWMKVNEDTRTMIDNALKNREVATIDDLVKKVISEIDDAEKRNKVQEVIDELNPKTSWTGIVWDHIKDPITDVITIGKFLAICNFTNKAVLYNAESWNLSLAQTRAIGAINSAYRARIAANFANKAIRGVNMGLTTQKIAMIERDIRLRVIDEAAEGEEIDFAKGIDMATKGVSQAEAAFAAARTGCIYAIVFVVIISTAEWAYNKYKEHEIADKLKEGIVHLCTARLYATQDKDTAETFSSLSIQQKQITNAINNNQPTASLVEMYVTYAKDLQTDAQTENRLKEIYDLLHEQDLSDTEAKDRLGDDPDFDTMKALHKKDLDDCKAAVEAQAKNKMKQIR